MFKSLLQPLAGKTKSYFSRDLRLTLGSITIHGMICSGGKGACGVFFNILINI